MASIAGFAWRFRGIKTRDCLTNRKTVQIYFIVRTFQSTFIPKVNRLDKKTFKGLEKPHRPIPQYQNVYFLFHFHNLKIKLQLSHFNINLILKWGLGLAYTALVIPKFRIKADYDRGENRLNKNVLDTSSIFCRPSTLELIMRTSLGMKRDRTVHIQTASTSTPPTFDRVSSLSLLILWLEFSRFSIIF